MLHRIHSNNLIVFLFQYTHNFFFLICIALINQLMYLYQKGLKSLIFVK